jgi:hypothetical protein
VNPGPSVSIVKAFTPGSGRWPATAAMALLLLTIESNRVWSAGDDGGVLHFLQVHGRWLVIELSTMGTGALLGPVFAERAGWHGWRQLALSMVMSFALVGAGAAVIHAAFGAELATAALSGGFASDNALLLRCVWFFSMAGLLFSSFASSRDRGRVAVRAAQLAEVECIEMQRGALELRLQALQARLDPGAVQSSLGEIGRLYRHDPPAAEARLDELIAYLRAALPNAPGSFPLHADPACAVAGTGPSRGGVADPERSHSRNAPPAIP